MEVQLHVDVRMRQKAGTQTTKIKSAKSFVLNGPSAKIYTLEIYPLYGNFPELMLSQGRIRTFGRVTFSAEEL